MGPCCSAWRRPVTPVDSEVSPVDRPIRHNGGTTGAKTATATSASLAVGFEQRSGRSEAMRNIPSLSDEESVPSPPAAIQPVQEAYASLNEPAPVAPLRFLASTARTAVKSVVMSMLYVPFLLAVLVQSAMVRQGFPTTEWETRLTGRAWAIALVSYALLLAAPALVFALPRDSVVELASVYYLPIAAVHVLTFYYASTLPEMCSVDRLLTVNWRVPVNVAAVLLPFVELYQLLGLTRASQMLPPVADQILGYGVLRLWDDQTGLLIGFSAALIYWALVGFAIAIGMSTASPAATIVFDFIPGVCFLPIVSTQLRLFANDFTRFWTFLALLGFLFFTSTAPFVGTYRSNELLMRHNINYIPVFTVVERSLKCFAAVANEFFTHIQSSEPARAGTIGAVFLLLLAIFVYTQPCSSTVVATIRALTLSLGVWAMVASCIATAANDSSLLWKVGAAWPFPALVILLFHRWRQTSVW